MATGVQGSTRSLSTFINGTSDAGGSRNLFIWGMNYDGTDYTNNVANLLGGGAGAFLIGHRDAHRLGFRLARVACQRGRLSGRCAVHRQR